MDATMWRTMFVSCLLAACASSQSVPEATLTVERTSNVVPVSEVTWEQLNPARGDKSPKAATLWGDRNGAEATGFLVQFVDGFSSPPHIHNVSYRGIVISGLVHNDEPNAPEVWMPAGSFWTQPKGEVHITASQGVSVAYIEIEQGPYLVRPPDKAFSTEETPIRMEAPNMTWQPVTLGDASDQAQVAVLWETDGRTAQGSLFKLQTQADGVLQSHGRDLRAVVIQGSLSYQNTERPDTLLNSGSYFDSRGKAAHRFSCQSKEPCLLYVRSPRMIGEKTVAPGPALKGS